MRDVLQRRQQRRAVGILKRLVAVAGEHLMRHHAHAGRFARERIELLREHIPAADDGIQQLPAELCHKRFVPVALQGDNRALIRQPLALPAPVVFRRIAEQRVVHRNARQGQRRPEFLRIQQVLAHKRIRHLLTDGTPVHAAQRVMAQHVDGLAVLVAVKAGVALVIPQACFQVRRDRVRLFAPFAFPPVAAQAADFRQCIAAGVGERRHVHRRHRHNVRIFGRRIGRAVDRRVTVAQGVVLPRIVDAEGFKTSVAVGIARFPEIRIEFL